MSLSAPTLRQILTNRLTPEDFDGFCHDHFHQIYRQFISGQTYDQRIRLLLQHVRTHNQLSQLYNHLIHDHPHISVHLPPLSSDLDTFIPSADFSNQPAQSINASGNTIRDNNQIIDGSGNTQTHVKGDNVQRDKIEHHYYYAPGHTHPLPFQPVQLPSQPCHNLRPGSHTFVGRDNELNRLHEFLHRDTHVPRAAIVGQGGLGKTELALQYAHRHLAHHPGGVCWLTVGDPSLDLLAIGLLNFARDRCDLHPPEDNRPPSEKLSWLWAHWRPDGPILLVLDNVNDTSLPAIHALLRLGLPDRLRLLVTTRIQLTHNWQVLSLDTLSPEASAQLFRQLSSVPDNQIPILDQLCQRLGHLPLALELVAIYHATRISFLTLDKLLDNINTRTVAADALSRLPSGACLTAERSLEAAFQLSWDALPENAKLLACRLALFAPAPIPLPLLLDSLEEDLRNNALEDLTQRLVHLHLAKIADNQTILLHPLLRDYYRYQLDHEFLAQKPNLSAQVVIGIVKECQKVPYNCTLAAQAQFAFVAPHAVEVAERLHQRLSANDLFWPGEALARFHQGQSAWKESESWRRRTLALCDTTFGPEHPYTLDSLNNFANLLQAQGDLAGAEPLYRRVLEASERVLGPEHPGTLTSLNNLAVLLKAQGDLAGVELLHRRALEASERVLGPEHLHTLGSLNNLAFLLYDKGNLAEAEPLYRRALEAMERIFGPENFYTLNSLNNLASLLQNKGDLAGAESLFRRALEARERVFGPEHPNTLNSLNNLAGLLQTQGDLAGAELLFRRALEAYEHVLGPEHPHTLNSLNNFASLLQAKGDLAGAEPLFRRTLETGRRVLPEQSELRLAIEDNWTWFQDVMAQSREQ